MNNRGFTLLEIVVAIALLAIILVTVYGSQASSLFSSSKLRNVQIATNLARKFMLESELELQKLNFDTIDMGEATGNFPEPYPEFSWKRKVEAVDFAALSEVLLAQIANDPKAAISAQDNTVLKYFQDYLNKSVRRMLITVEWPDGDKKASLGFTTLLVRYDADFATGL
jgi:prepilin-type N-terminal cleavage/methylation domain-containing protein